MSFFDIIDVDDFTEVLDFAFDNESVSNHSFPAALADLAEDCTLSFEALFADLDGPEQSFDLGDTPDSIADDFWSSSSPMESVFDPIPNETARSPCTLDKRNKRHREHKNYDPPFGTREYHRLTDKDVGMGRGGDMNRHAGNLRFHQAKELLQPLYHSMPQVDRTVISQHLVDAVHFWGGCFLKKDSKGWYEVHNHTARTKCSQALREDYTREQRAEKRRLYRLRKRQKS